MLSKLIIFVGMKENSQLLKGTLTTVILKLLNDNHRMYGYEMTKKVKEITNGSLLITEGALYPALHKLEAEGHIKSTIEQFENRPRKYYQLTTDGKKEAKKKLSDLFNFINDLQSILQLKPVV